MTSEEKRLTTILMAVALAFFIGVAVTMVLAHQEIQLLSINMNNLRKIIIS